MLICLFSLLLLPPPVPSSTLILQTINKPDALCNDHSTAKFYIDKTPPAPASTKWIIYLESGGGCSTLAQCKERYKTSRILMSSVWLDEHPEITGLDVLSDDKRNPFSGYNHVYLPYCSSDMYVGMKKKESGEGDFDEEDENFVFSGYYIVRGLIEHLKDDHGAAKFTEIILAGSSAGGVGVMNHLPIVSQIFQDNANNIEIRGIVDSSWFINFEDNFLQFWDTESAQDLSNFHTFPKLKDSDAESQCAMEYGGIPCCFQGDCLEHHGAFNDYHLLFIQSKHDIYMLQSSVVGT